MMFGSKALDTDADTDADAAHGGSARMGSDVVPVLEGIRIPNSLSVRKEAKESEMSSLV